MNQKLLRICSVLLLVIYIGVDYLHWFSFETLSPYAIYFFEVIWAGVILLLFRKTNWLGSISRFQKMILAILLPMGFITHFVARTEAVTVPFDFQNTETILFLLLIGPVLEELVFRGALWRLVETWISKRILVALLTSVFFSYSHFHAIFGVPDEYKPFVVYQTAYTFVLAMICAELRIRSGLLIAILGHMLFNLGFWLGR